MPSKVLWLEALERKLNMLPHLRTLEHWPDFQLTNGKCDALQFCFRLSSDTLQTLEVKVDGELHKVDFPHLMVKYPGQKIEFLNADTADVFYFSYQREALAFFAGHGLPENFSIATIPLPRSLGEVMKLVEIARDNLNEPGFADRLDLGCYTLIHETMLLLAEKNASLPDIDKKILKIASFLQTHFSEKADIGQLAAKYGFSRRNFLRHWARIVKTPPGNYLNDFKILEAKRQLKESSRPLSAISTQLGFCDEGYFCRFFKRRTGMTPREYRDS